jgi:hypothetical protein
VHHCTAGKDLPTLQCPLHFCRHRLYIWLDVLMLQLL